MGWIYEVAVVLHVLAAVVWVGGVLYAQGRQAVVALGRRFRPVGWTALGVAIVTGLYMIG